ncbi:GTP-binding protein TypA [candidate division WWE3 bacterium RIFCSPHIGHO2_01_FULL_42_13]|uniref:50S ribosomal subunit assembly factor BipA n=1 Tax=candidate division WWE3 bacterium RIFCSPHIGHO2_01_FULL_42_13 TaxID=1802617 RepID=A0A1F4URS5_UNCKA|nr:MAG: GTP-binding protein TypA [candidate division WWE3 bacterium RIFCSPHIGHO2_01_FULL_42_13]
MKLRNVAIIAHVDHGKTTIVDGLLKQSKTFRENEAFMHQDLIMDSNDQERERGITILAKNIAVSYKGTKINIIDTPGHADFGGEVERTLNMADGALLVVDAQEGPMPQTKFVLKKALELNLKIIVIVNKIDKPNSLVDNTISKISDLFLELVAHEDQLDFPVVYAWGKAGKAWNKVPADPNAPADFAPIFEAIINNVPEPKVDEGAFQMLVTALDWDSYKGKYAIGRIKRGEVKSGQEVTVIKPDGTKKESTAEKVYVNQGLGRVEAEIGIAGDIITLTGIETASIGDTVTDPATPEALPTIKVEEPTLAITIGPNTSPFRGTEGNLLTGTKILERIKRELQTNVAMKFKISEDGKYVLSGRGELHLSVFLETLRREGFEVEVSKPTVITKVIDGIEMEPVEELTVDVDSEYVGAVKSEVGKRRGGLISQEQIHDGSTRLVFEITTRGLLGLRGTLLTLTKGTTVISSIFLKNQKMGPKFQKLRKGVLIASHTGKSITYGLVGAHEKGPVFVEPQVPVYEGMIVGVNGRDEDIELNVCREKQLTNNRSAGEDVIFIPPATEMSLEQKLGFIEDDELLEITPTNLRLRKKILNADMRRRAQRNAKNA